MKAGEAIPEDIQIPEPWTKMAPKVLEKVAE